MLKAKLLGATAAAESLAIEDVFSTYLYTGNGTARTITNGIDLAGEGGLVWIKLRSTSTAFSFSHALFDTERGVLQYHRTDGTNASSNYNNSLTSFNSDGFSLGTDPSTGLVNYGTGTNTYASWTFRQAPRFFDVVTYTGTGANRTIAHDLGVVPGCIIVKRTDTTGDWQVYHRSNANTEYMVLNTTDAKATGATRWNSTTPTSTVFSIGTDATVNASGGTYVAYLYAHDPLGPSEDGSDGLIACGGFTTDGSGRATINLGWEPQFVIWKPVSTTGNWEINDQMRGWNEAEGKVLFPDTSAAEGTRNNVSTPWKPTATGIVFDFSVLGGALANTSYIYIAIRRGPMREPTVGTEVFAVANGTTPVPTWKSGFPVDLGIYKATGGNDSSFVTRLLGKTRLVANSSAAEAAQTNAAFDYQNGHYSYYDASLASWYSWMFRRAPGFFDVVAYTGDGVAGRTVPHNLGVAPEMMIVKSRNNAASWICYHKDIGNTKAIYLNSTSAATTASSGWWNDTTPTESVFTLGANTTQISNNYISYHFATLAGVSKVGSYTGNGTSQTINCAFTTGARFVLIKRTDSTGDWYVWDTARGIVSGNDPHLSLNTQAAEVTTDDTIDPDSTGFIVNQVAATNVNVNAATYIYLAIA